MEVSRDYIRSDVLEEFPVADRFLKLPLENFMALDGLEPIEPQRALINAIQDPRHRFVVGALSRRTGKTTIANSIAFLKWLEPNTKVLIISPNYSLSNISWNEQVRMINAHGVETIKMNSKDKEIEGSNGSLLKLASVTNANSAVGRSYDLILFDEAALDSKGEEAFNVCLRPTLDKENSKAIFISTPRGHNFFHEFYMRGFSDLKEHSKWASVHSTFLDNPRTVQSDIDEAKSNMSRAEFEQEYMASFNSFEGQIYEGFDFENCVQDLSAMEFDDNDTDNIMGIDPGYRDATAGIVCKYHWKTDKYYVVWDYLMSEKTTDQHAESFSEAIDKYAVDHVFIDSAAAQFRADLAGGHDIPSSAAKKSVLDGLSYCQMLIENKKVIVDVRCKHVIEMIRNYRWDMNPNLINVKPVHDQYSHIADAFRYMLYTLAT